VGEYEKETLLSMEKEVLGVYISGHPLQAYEALWKNHITAKMALIIMRKEPFPPPAGWAA
jgi:DNA polymerase-3 subunit alpha